MCRGGRFCFATLYYDACNSSEGIGLGLLVDNTILFRVERFLLSSFSRDLDVQLLSNDFISIFIKSGRKVTIVKVVPE